MRSPELNKPAAYRPWVIRLCLIFVAVMMVPHTIGYFASDLVAPLSPQALIALSPGSWNTVRVAAAMSFWTFMFISVIRRWVTDPAWYVLGRAGTAPLHESSHERVCNFAKLIDQMNARLGKSRFYDGGLLAFHFVSADMVTCFLLGYRRVNLRWVLVINVIGTIVTVYLMYRAGLAFATFMGYALWGFRAMQAYAAIKVARKWYKSRYQGEVRPVYGFSTLSRKFTGASTTLVNPVFVLVVAATVAVVVAKV